jgi:carboxyl-terminal processing protease
MEIEPSAVASRRTFWGRWLTRAPLALLLTACTAGVVEDPESYDSLHATRLFSVGYQDISEIFIRQVEIPELAHAGFENLSTLDSELSISNDGETVIMARGGLPVASFPAPEPADTGGWGALTASLLATGRTVSPPLSQSSSERLYEVMFDGLITELDNFSRYAGREEARENRASRDGFGGIGVRIRVEDEGVKILSVMENTPAEKAGLHAQDVITDIDGKPAIGLSQREVVRRLRGPVRTKVGLLVQREEVPDKLPITVTRAHVVPQTVKLEIEDGIGYMRVSSFNQSTTRNLRQKLKEADRKLGDELIGFILDLRGNPGGLLDQAVEVSDLFVTEGRIVSTRGRHPDSHQYFDAESDDLAQGLPVVVLLDGGSASASEIVAAALQDAGRAVLVGTNSFGKGTVQTVLRLPNEGELTLTWATFHAPSGYGLNERGVLPNLCTSGQIAGADDVLQKLPHGAFPLHDQLGVTPPDGADQAQIAAIRASCPRREGDSEIDLDVARRLLLEPALYVLALGKTPDAAGLEQQAGPALLEPQCAANLSDRPILPGSC